MVSFREKAKIKKAGNLNQGRSYVITTVHNSFKGLGLQDIQFCSTLLKVR